MIVFIKHRLTGEIHAFTATEKCIVAVGLTEADKKHIGNMSPEHKVCGYGLDSVSDAELDEFSSECRKILDEVYK
jgi:hypothetical protein